MNPGGKPSACGDVPSGGGPAPSTGGRPITECALRSTTIPGGKYACTRYRGNGSDIGASWHSLLRDWLSASGMQLDSRPFFEYYPRDAQYDPKTGVFECDLCIPVVSL